MSMGRLLKVLQLNDAIGGESGRDRSGGVERSVELIARELAARGHTVDVLAAGGQATRAESLRFGRADAVRLKTLGYVGPLPIAPGALSRLRERAADYDVIHLHLPSPLMETACALLGRPLEDKLVVTVHADPNDTRYEWARPIIYWLLKRNLTRARRVTTTAPGNEIELGDLVTREQYEVTPLGIDASRFTNGVRGEAFPRGVPDRYALFVSRVVYYKGLEVLIRSVQDLDLPVVIVGEGPLREELKRLATTLGVSDRAIFLGYVEDDKLGELYRSAEVFILPSISEAEAFGLVQVEAMWHGCPVVNTRLNSGVPWVSKHGETGLTVPPGDPAALADAVNKLVKDPALRERLSAAARERAEAFTSEMMAQRIEAVYRTVVQGR